MEGKGRTFGEIKVDTEIGIGAILWIIGFREVLGLSRLKLFNKGF
ncbi:hypothetical protein THC_0484 [Caldimicrobium thiodismutans]|uniref:Uncharacterized protein n=1 Tax=Caldimicrobium thiodismutans TaxID=1653476 RepID=A0A0U5AWD4_9BACT|nr:hypothetical protein [Caldimicrobium thiodismutans]BAU22878.1 hypothetical protein THC_0484 [Caldimicrobium thiodismutans]